MRWLLIITAVLAFAASACKGVCDSLQFHYDTSLAADFDNQRFWDPDVSWENKYALSDEGELLRPLRPKHIGSTTWLVWTTDAWHLFQTIQYALIRAALTFLLMLPLSVSRRPSWYYALAIYAGLWIIQAAGFHLTYTLL